MLQRFHPDIAKFVKALLDNGGFGVCGELPKVSDPKTRYGIGKSSHMIDIANEMKVRIDFVDSNFLAHYNVLLTTENIFVSIYHSLF